MWQDRPSKTDFFMTDSLVILIGCNKFCTAFYSGDVAIYDDLDFLTKAKYDLMMSKVLQNFVELSLQNILFG